MTFESPTRPPSYSTSAAFAMSVPARLAGLHAPAVGVSFVPTQVLTGRPRASRSVRVTVPAGPTVRFASPVPS